MNRFSRRNFLLTAGAAALALPASRVFAAPPKTGLGFSLYGMKSVPTEQALKVCADIGYDSVELALLPGFQTDITSLSAADRVRLKEQLAASKLRVAGLMDNFTLVADEATRPKILARIKAAGQLAHELSPDAPPVLETVLGGKPADWDKIKDGMAAQLQDWAKAAEEAKLVIAIKGHIMHAAQKPEQVLWLLQQANSPWIKVAYDFSHFQLQGLSLETTMAEMLPQTRFLHVKDTRPLPDGKFEFLLPGEGNIDYVAYFKQLRRLGYPGDVVVEVGRAIWDKPGYDPIEAARKSFTALNAARQAAAA
jgi:sugar phosphate isomerase/epimerase